MLKMLMILAAVFALSACSTTEKSATVGGVTGAVIGGLATGTLLGAAVGGAIGATTGAVAGELLGRDRSDPTQCVYEDRRTGKRYLEECPLD